MWAARALVTLPVSLIGYAAVCLWLVSRNAVYPALWPHPALFIGPDDRHRGAVFTGGRAVLEYRQQNCQPLF